MNTTTTSTSTRRRLLIGAPLAALAVLGAGIGMAGLANAGTLPTNGDTVAMTIYNNTDQTMYLNSMSNPQGDWIAAPQNTLAPNSHEIVTAAGSGPSMSVSVDYSIGGGAHHAVFSANQAPYSANTDGTGIMGGAGAGYDLSTHIDSGNPAMNVGYWLNG